MTDENETPTRQLPIMAVTHEHLRPLVIALEAVLAEMKMMGRRVEGMAVLMNNNVTDIAVIKVQNEGQAGLLLSLTARVTSLESERRELTNSILGKAIALVLVLAAGVAAALWIITHKAG